ncbi:MAG: hypothetical protein ABR543_04475 [Gemmatimonadaceae bacterium]
MAASPQGNNRKLWSATAIGVALLAACVDASPTGKNEVVVPVTSQPLLAEVRASVDAATGTISFQPVANASRVQGLRTQMYGSQNVNLRLYNDAPQVTSTAVLKTITTNVGIRNLLVHPIGDEENSGPADVLGIFVFFTTEPVVTQPNPCAGCFARVAKHHGTGTFDAPNRKYYYWRERLASAGSPGDTSTRRLWTFEMSPQVTNFVFTVLVSAAWPPPYETRWKVRYTAATDSEPDLYSEPRWTRLTSGAGGLLSILGGNLRLVGNPLGELYQIRRDSITTTGDAYIEASIDLNTRGSSAQVGMAFADGVKLVALGIAGSRVGFVTYPGLSFIGTPYSVSTDNFHTYQLRKYKADSAVFFMDGVRRGRISYSSFSADPNTPVSPYVIWGAGATRSGSNSDWRYVLYELGSPMP